MKKCKGKEGSSIVSDSGRERAISRALKFLYTHRILKLISSSTWDSLDEVHMYGQNIQHFHERNIELSCITYIRLKVMYRQLCSCFLLSLSLCRHSTTFLFFWISFIIFFSESPLIA